MHSPLTLGGKISLKVLTNAAGWPTSTGKAKEHSVRNTPQRARAWPFRHRLAPDDGVSDFGAVMQVMSITEEPKLAFENARSSGAVIPTSSEQCSRTKERDVSDK